MKQQCPTVTRGIRRINETHNTGRYGKWGLLKAIGQQAGTAMKMFNEEPTNVPDGIA